MSISKEFIAGLNIVNQCRKHNISLWQCPQFLFLVMGAFIIFSIITTYFISNRYIEQPEIVALISMGIAMVMFIISFFITQGFERLAEASRMKSEFINIVSHQLRSPLANLKWATEFLMSGKLGEIKEKQIEYFNILKENNVRMTELVGDLLISSRIDQGAIPLQKQEISLQEIAENLVRNFKPLADGYKVNIVLQVQDNLPKLFADPSHIKLVVENLIDNAIRYTKDGGSVMIRLSRTGFAIRLEVQDSGVGIPEKDQKLIFQKFFRSENAMRHQTKGSGLGLFIAKAIVERSGGRMGFQSQEGKGSNFWFTLPIS